MNNKYRLEGPVKHPDFPGRTLYQVVSLRDDEFHDIKTGDKGGLVEGEHNLNKDDFSGAWIGEGVVVVDQALVGGHALVEGNSVISDTAIIDALARVKDSQVKGAALISDRTRMEGSNVSGEVRVGGSTQINESTLEGEMIITDSQLKGATVTLSGARIRDGKISGSEQVMVVDQGAGPVSIYPAKEGGFTAVQEFEDPAKNIKLNAGDKMAALSMAMRHGAEYDASQSRDTGIGL